MQKMWLCCRNLRGGFYGEVPKIPPYLFRAITPPMMTISLYEWEILALKSKATELSLSYKVKPNLMFWDEISSTPFILTWELDHDNCPFLSIDNLCMVQEQKPLVCQAYPLLGTGYLDDNENQPHRLNVGYGDCPNLIVSSDRISRTQIVSFSTVLQELFESYGDAFVGNLRFESATRLVADVLRDATKKNLIRPSIVNKSIVKDILRKKPLGFLQYLRNKHPEYAREVEESIKTIYEFDTSAVMDIINGKMKT
jgi:Fe-S-cluster containining protein